MPGYCAPVLFPLARGQQDLDLGFATRMLTGAQKFYLSVWVVKATPVEALVKKLELDGLRLSKESVLRESELLCHILDHN